MKIIQINAVYGYGSTGLIVKGIEQATTREGGESFIVYQSAASSPENGFKMGNSLDRNFHGLMARVFGKQAYFSINETKRLIKKLSLEKPDVVHLHNLHSNYINLPMLLQYLADENIPTVITLHDCWFFTGKCFHFVACGCDKWQTKCNNCPQNKNDVVSWFVDSSEKVFEHRRMLMQNIDNLTIVGCSKWVEDLAKKSPMFKGKNFSQIYNGVDTDVFMPKDRDFLRSQHGFSDKFVIMGMANKWLNERNKAVLESVIKNLSDSEMLMIVGCTDMQIQQLSQYAYVKAIGFIKERDELAKIYNIADVFVNLTFEDTLPTVNMEAICCGTPVITYDTCGSPELVCNGETGYIVPILDSEALNKAIGRVKQGIINRNKCAEIGKCSFDEDKLYTDYISLYDNICS